MSLTPGTRLGSSEAPPRSVGRAMEMRPSRERRRGDHGWLQSGALGQYHEEMITRIA